MAQVHKTVLVEYSASHMRDLVEDVLAYPQFLPWCGGSAIRSQEGAITVASVTIDFHGVKQTFTTRNTRISDALLDIALVDGPFKRLEGHWKFVPLGEPAATVVTEGSPKGSGQVSSGVSTTGAGPTSGEEVGTGQGAPAAIVGCKVELSLEYEFSSRILERLIGPVFARICDTFVDCFVSRADQLKAADTLKTGNSL
jgi:ribosome-associated toxin RatA of RatAB toxin-antitoxin module